MRRSFNDENHDRFGGFDSDADFGPQAYVPPTSGTAGGGKPIYDWAEAASWLSRESNGWNGANGAPLTITYAFRKSAPGAMPDDTAGFSRFSPAQITAATEALNLWAEAANITFTRVGTGAGANAYSNNATILFGNYASGAADASAFAYFPGARAAGSVAGDIWVNSSLPDNAPTFEDVGPRILLHEIGHALGLSHPGNYNGGAPTYAADAVYWQDSNMFTVMSYFGSAETGADRSVFATGPQLHDIAAIQLLYGANTHTREGATIYGFHSNTGHASMTLTSSTDAAVFTIWDSGGNDTLDLSGYTTASNIDLQAESFTSCGPGDANAVALYNIAIARGVVIENAIGGAGADVATGNAAVNSLRGGGGGDVLSGLAAGDFLLGEGGADTLNGGQGADFLNGGVGADVLIGGIGADAFIFNLAASAANADTVSDFVVGIDEIQLENSVFTTLGAAGELADYRFRVGAAAADGSDRIIYDDATGALYYDPDGVAAGAKVRIATLDAHLTLTAADILVI